MSTANPPNPLVFQNACNCGNRAALRDHRAELVAAALVRHLLRGEREGHEERDLARRQFQIGRQHADDLVGLAVETDLAPDDPAIAAEPRAPEPVRQDRKTIGLRLGVVFSEGAAEEGLPPQRREEGGRDGEAAQLLGQPVLREVEHAAGEERRVLDRRRLSLAIEVVGNRHARLRQAHQRVPVPDEHEPFGLGIRQRLEQQLVEEAENGGVRADAERERQHRDEREDRVLAEAPERVTDVLHECLDGCQPVKVARRVGRTANADRGTGDWRFVDWRLTIDCRSSIFGLLIIRGLKMRVSSLQ
jgi:hypothetical protein